MFYYSEIEAFGHCRPWGWI